MLDQFFAKLLSQSFKLFDVIDTSNRYKYFLKKIYFFLVKKTLSSFNTFARINSECKN